MLENTGVGLKEKTIKLLLQRKINDWLKHIDDKELVYMISRDVLITGGAIASMLLGEKVNDYDAYFRTRETALAVAKYYAKVMNTGVGSEKIQIKEELRTNIKGVEENRIIMFIQSDGVVEEPLEKLFVVDEIFTKLKQKKPRYRPVFISENAITLSDDMQLVVRFYGDAEEIHKNYDFVHTTNVYTFWNNTLTLNLEALVSLMSKSLVYRGSLYPMASLFRIRKFLERGFRITAGQMLKIVFQLNELNLNDMDVLHEQLVGIDMSYMLQLIAILKKAPKDTTIDSTYVAKVIDEIFE